MGVANDVQFYTDWVNNEFRLSWKQYYVEDLIEEFSCGYSLVHFINALFDEELPVLYYQPKSLFERQQNIQICLQLLSEEKVNLTGVTTADIASGDIDVILTLCAAIKRRKGVGFRRFDTHFFSNKNSDVIEDYGIRCWQSESGNQNLNYGSSRNLHQLSRCYDGHANEVDWWTNNQLHDPDVADSGTNGKSQPMNDRHFFGQSNRTSNVAVPSKYEFSNDVLVSKKSSMKKLRSGISKYQEVSFLLTESQRRKKVSDDVIYSKEDIALFDWISTTLAVPITDYGSFADGIVLYRLLCMIIPNCISQKVFYASQPDQRIQLVLETSCHELYFTTDLTAHNIRTQKNFNSFRVYLTYLKSCFPLHTGTKTSHKQLDFSLGELKSIYTFNFAEPSRMKPENQKPDSLVKTGNQKFIPTKREMAEHKKNIRTEKNILELSDVTRKFESPTWTKILHQELQMRASQNETRLSSNVPTPIEEMDTISYMDVPSYTRDTDRITKYDNEIAAIFDNDTDNNSDCEGTFDRTSEFKRPEHSAAVSVKDGNRKKEKKYLDITSDVRSQSRSPSGLRKTKDIV